MILTMCIRRLKYRWDNCWQIDLMPWLPSSDAGYPQKIRATNLHQLLSFVCNKRYSSFIGIFCSSPASICNREREREYL